MMGRTVAFWNFGRIVAQLRNTKIVEKISNSFRSLKISRQEPQPLVFREKKNFPFLFVPLGLVTQQITTLRHCIQKNATDFSRQ